MRNLLISGREPLYNHTTQAFGVSDSSPVHPANFPPYDQELRDAAPWRHHGGAETLRLTPPGYTDIGLRFWMRAKAGAHDRRGRELADDHYPRQSHGAPQFVGPGEGRIVLITRDHLSVWAWLRPRYPKDGRDAWRCTIFRRTGGPRASELILDAERALLALGVQRAPDGLLTYVQPERVRSTNPGCCYLAAGWHRDGWTRGGHGRTPRLRLVKRWGEIGRGAE